MPDSDQAFQNERRNLNERGCYFVEGHQAPMVLRCFVHLLLRNAAGFFGERVVTLRGTSACRFRRYGDTGHV